MAKKPECGSIEWEQRLWKNPAFVRRTLKSLTDRAATGDKDAVAQLAKVVAARPELKAATVQVIEDLSEKAEAAWISLVAAGNQLASDALRDKVAAMKAELRIVNTGAIGEILINDVVVSCLANIHATTAAAETAPNQVAAHRDRRVESTQRRVATAIKNWQLLVRKVARESVPPGVQLLDLSPRRPRRPRRQRTGSAASRLG